MRSQAILRARIAILKAKIIQFPGRGKGNPNHDKEGKFSSVLNSDSGLSDKENKQERNKSSLSDAFAEMVHNAQTLPTPLKVDPVIMANLPHPSTWTINRGVTLSDSPKDVFFVSHPDTQRGYGTKPITAFFNRKAAEGFVDAALRNSKKL